MVRRQMALNDRWPRQAAGEMKDLAKTEKEIQKLTRAAGALDSYAGAPEDGKESARRGKPADA